MPTDLRPGDAVEFRSADRGYCWKPGVLVRVCCGSARIRVGERVCIARPATTVRLVRRAKEAS